MWLFRFTSRVYLIVGRSWVRCGEVKVWFWKFIDFIGGVR